LRETPFLADSVDRPSGCWVTSESFLFEGAKVFAKNHHYRAAPRILLLVHWEREVFSQSPPAPTSEQDGWHPDTETANTCTPSSYTHSDFPAKTADATDTTNHRLTHTHPTRYGTRLSHWRSSRSATTAAQLDGRQLPRCEGTSSGRLESATASLAPPALLSNKPEFPAQG
jgi:hypothetical protein